MKQAKNKTQNYIESVRNELFAGNLDLERITKAYAMITGNNYPANLLVMKRAIINHTSYLD